MLAFLRRLRRPRPTAPTPAPSAQDADLEAATAMLRALSCRAQRMRQAWLGRPLSPEQKIAAFEAEAGRDAARRW